MEHKCVAHSIQPESQNHSLEDEGTVAGRGNLRENRGREGPRGGRRGYHRI